MKVDIQPISSAIHIEEALGIAELIALFRGVCYFSDLEWDEDELLRSYLEIIPEDLKRDYADERATGIQFAKDHVVSGVVDLIKDRNSNLNDNYPFDSDFTAELLLSRKMDISPSGVSYLWLSFFWLLKSEKDYLVIDPNPARFIALFERVFEIICCYVLAGRVPGPIWYLGDSRSVTEFLRRLQKVTEFCGSGAVKGRGDLRANQTGANDGGVDILAIRAAQGVIQGDSEGYLLGATIQKAARNNKLIGANQLTRFRTYFSQNPNIPFTGVLAIPFEGTEAEAETCGEQGCVYLTKDQLIRYLGTQPTEDYRLRYLRYPGTRLARATRSLQEFLRLASNDGPLAIAWA